MLKPFVEKISTHLENKGLPGKEAQYIMAPNGRRSRENDADTSKARKAGVCLLLYSVDDSIKFPLMKRTAYGGVHSAQISLPGGKLEPDDANIKAAAFRETEEEIGIDRLKIEPLAELTQLYIPPSNFLVTPQLAFHNSLPNFVPEATEVDKIIEVEISTILDDSICGIGKVPVRNGLKITTPYFKVSNEIVWGATAMILSEFKEILKATT